MTGKRKHKLSVSMDEDICLLGIVSDEPDYKLCWLMNTSLHTSFERKEDIQVYHKRADSEQFFPLFSYTDENSMLVYRLIVNQSENGYYLEEVKNIDYLLHIQGELVADDLQDLIDSIGQLDSVRMCLPLDLRKIRLLDRLHVW